jgi:ferredoxin--NADP+ reductase
VNANNGAMTTQTEGPVLRPAEMHLLTPNSPGEATVVSTERCTASRKSASFVRHVALDVSGTPLAGRFAPGQSFGVIPPGTDGAGKPHKLRLYSIASPSRGEDGQGNVLATTVKRTIDEHREHHRLFLGVCSNYLCDLQVGDRVKVTGPSGKRFVLPADPASHDYIFVATGTGIAPFRGMVKELEVLAPAARVMLVMGAAYATDLLYHSDFEEAASRPGFTYLTALSRERQADGGRGMYAHERLLSRREQTGELLASSRTLVYVCGIAGMELGVLQAIATILGPSGTEAYLRGTQNLMRDPGSWDRRMIPRQVQPSRRVFLEVYD